MRWKWLLVLSLLITLSALSVNGNDDEEEKVAENDESVKEDEQIYDEEENVDESVNEDEKDPVDDPGEIISAVQQEESTNEDTVDVEIVGKSKQRGNLYNYEDYIASNLDTSDTNYNWNGE